MARSYAALKSSTWAPGSEFRLLDPLAQWAFWMLISQPQITNLGLLAYTPEKWARLAHGLNLEIVEGAIAILEASGYVVVDVDTAELLVRTFITHDNVYSQPRLVTNARKLIVEVESDRIRNVLVSRHPWLVEAFTKDEILAYEEARAKAPETPPERGIAGLSPPRAPAGPGQGPGSSSRSLNASRTEANGDAHAIEDGRDPAAADPTREAPRESAVAAAIAELPGADMDTHRVVEPLARQLPAVLFEDITTRLRNRIRTGAATNPPGLLVSMLQTACREQAVRDRPPTSALTHRARIELEASSYAIAGHAWDVVEPLLRNNLRRHDAPRDDLADLMAAAAAAYSAADDREGALA